MENPKTIYLIGMMGSWKTTVGKLLSKRLKLPFFDTDGEITKLTGMNTSQIFRTRGEDYFRNEEAHLLKRLSAQPGQVISTGGGIVLQESNRLLMKSTGIPILLYAHPKILVQRIKNLKSRPLLVTSDLPEYTLTKLWYERKELYYSAAQFEINTEEHTPYQVSDQIIELLAKEHV